MHLVFLTRRSWPAIGGAESYLRHLTRELGSRHEVRVLSMRIDNGPWARLTDSLFPPPSFERFNDGPVSVEPFTIPPRRRALLLPLITQVTPGLRRYAYGRARIAAAALYARVVAPRIVSQLGRASVLHLWGGDMLATACVRAARRHGVPVVMTPFVHRHQWGDDPASALSYRRADAVISLLETDAGWYRELGVARDRIHVAGVCTPASPAGGGVRLRLRYGIRGPLVLHLAVRRSYKGSDLFLEAAQQVARRRPDVTFALVGPGPALRGEASPARVLDVGLVDDAERADWLDAADLLCLPSSGEIFPVSILEAWSLRRPVLATNLPTLQELIARADGGITAPLQAAAFADAMLRLIAAPAVRRAMGEAGHRFWAARHTPAAMASWHEQLYRCLLQEPAKCAS